VQCVVARAAITDCTTCLGYRVEPMISDFLGMVFSRREGIPSQHLEEGVYREASPISHVTPDTAPFLLIHGDQDATVPFEQSEMMLAALLGAGVAAELLTIPGAGHGPNFPGAVNPPDYLGAMTRWFDRHLSAG
jgi:dipeptidyl aminopeptidase/acylaminoacyl peptidase